MRRGMVLKIGSQRGWRGGSWWVGGAGWDMELVGGGARDDEVGRCCRGGWNRVLAGTGRIVEEAFVCVGEGGNAYGLVVGDVIGVRGLRGEGERSSCGGCGFWITARVERSVCERSRLVLRLKRVRERWGGWGADVDERLS